MLYRIPSDFIPRCLTTTLHASLAAGSAFLVACGTDAIGNASPSLNPATNGGAGGLTLTDYRTRLRLLAFIRSVDAGRTLLAAALQAGFGSYSQCHRTFSQTFGCTPRRFFGSQLRAEMRDAFSPLE
ncbi:MAG: helix-turn-helix domain-containing protein [Deltaproteobacteria bacterium]